MLTRRQRLARGLITMAVLVALAAGTIWGQDDHFPFGPFRMYSTTSDPNGTVNVLVFRAVTEAGAEIELRSQDFGLRPAEADGQRYFIEDDPSHLRHFMSAYERRHPEGPELAELLMYRGEHRLQAGRPVAYQERLIASWSEP